MATRYDQKTKDEVVAYVQRHNAENGRGGQSAAMAKWNLSPITIKAWLEKAGVETPGRGSRKKRKGVRAKASAVKKESAASSVSEDGVSATLQRMMAVKKEIAVLEREFEKLKAKL